MKRQFGDVGWWFDTSVLTPADTAARLVAEASDRTTPLAAGWHTWLRRLHGIQRSRARCANPAAVTTTDRRGPEN
jgi:hypothetical protein